MGVWAASEPKQADHANSSTPTAATNSQLLLAYLMIRSPFEWVTTHITTRGNDTLTGIVGQDAASTATGRAQIRSEAIT